MKRLLFILLASLILGGLAFPVLAQPGMEETPDTVANLGSRKDFRQLVNWNALRNQLDREDIDTLQYTVGDSATATWQFIATDTATCTTGLLYRDSDDDSLWYCLDGAWLNVLSGSGDVALPEDLWTWSLMDSAQMETGRKYFPWYFPGPDSMHVDSTVAICPTGSPNFTWNYYWASDISGADTDAFSSAQTVSGADATSTGEWDIPDNANIPPGVFIWFDFGALTTKPPNGVSFTIKGTYY
jgi:hypothetical protein